MPEIGQLAREAQIRRAWRRHVPDLTDEEIATLVAVGLEGSKVELAVRVLRAARLPLPEWCCPGCGTSTRARMADRPPTPEVPR